MVHGLHHSDTRRLSLGGVKAHPAREAAVGLQAAPGHKGHEVLFRVRMLHAHGLQRVGQRLRQAAEGKTILPGLPEFLIGTTPEAPAEIQVFAVKAVPYGFSRTDFPGQAFRSCVFPLHLAGIRRKQRPVFFPADRGKKGLAAQVLAHPADQARGQEHRVPAAVRQFHKIGVPGVLDGRFPAQMPHGQNRVARIALIGAENAAAAGNGDRMIILRTAFGDQQIVPFADMVDMRRLR